MSSKIGHINLLEKLTGKRSAGKPHAAFDEAGAGDGHELTRQSSTLPVRGIEIPHTRFEYCGTLHIEREEKQRKQTKSKWRNHTMSTRPN